MLRRSLFFKVRSDTPDERAGRLEKAIQDTPRHVPCITRVAVGKTIPHQDGEPIMGGWTHVWDSVVDRKENMQAYLDSPYHRDVLAPFFRPDSPSCIIEEFTLVYFDPGDRRGTPEHRPYACGTPDARSPIKLNTMYRLKDDATPQQAAEFDRLVRDSTRAIGDIENWCLTLTVDSSELTPGVRMRAGDAWTRFLEWEILTSEGLKRAMAHKAHLALLPYFHPGNPKHLVSDFAMALYRPDRAVIAY